MRDSADCLIAPARYGTTQASRTATRDFSLFAEIAPLQRRDLGG